MKNEHTEDINDDEVKAEINRMENAIACMEAQADRLAEEAQKLRNHAFIAKDRKNRLKRLT